MIRELIEAGPPTNQRELVELLTARGIEADQSTVSRDLKEMGVVRLPGRNGGLAYGFSAERGGSYGEDELRRRAREFVTGVEPSGNLVILRTAPGNAQALAAILDRTHLDEVAGTVAGDDTILVVVREGYKARDLAGRFHEMAG
jgi:transcriptional regulator of arginine metabolism